MKLKNYGYVKKEVELRVLTIAELKNKIFEAYVLKGIRTVRLIDITSGTVAVFRSLNDLAQNDWDGNCNIELIGLPHGYGTEGDMDVVILFQFSDDTLRII